MPTYLVGPTRPYTTIQSAIDAIPSTLTGTGIHEVIIDAGTYTEAVVIAGKTVNSTDYIWVHAAAGDEHLGVVSDGVIITTSTSSKPLTCSVSYTRLDDLVFVNTVTSVGCADIGGTSPYIRRVFFRGGSTSTVVNAICNSGVFICCLFIGDNTTNAAVININSVSRNEYYNCGAYSGYHGYRYAGSGSHFPKYINCWGYHAQTSIPTGGTPSSFDGGSAVGSSNNASRGTDAPGADTQENLTLAQYWFVNSTLVNFHIFASSVLFSNGLDLSSTFNTDIELNLIADWSIGPFCTVVIPNTDIDGANECPIGQYYAADNFEIDDYLNLNKWTLGTGAADDYEVTDGSYHPNFPVGTVNPLPVLEADIVLTGNFKITVEVQAGKMDGANSNSNYFGIRISSPSSGGGNWARHLLLARQSLDVQRVVLGVGTPSTNPTLTALQNGISPNTPVILSIEYDGVNLIYSVDGVVKHSEIKPSGAVSIVRAYSGSYSSDGVDGIFDSLVAGWLLNWAHFWPYAGTDKLACGVQGQVPTTSSSPWVNRNEPHEKTDDAKIRSTKTLDGQKSTSSNVRSNERDAKVLPVKKAAGEKSKGLGAPGKTGDASVTLPKTKKGQRSAFISIMPELNGYGAVNPGLGTGNMVPFYNETLTFNKEYREQDHVGNSRAKQGRVSLFTSPSGSVEMPLRSNDIIPLFQAHFQKRIGTTPTAGTTFYEFTPSKGRVQLGGSAFGTGSYSGAGTSDAFSISLFKDYEGTGYHFKSGVVESLTFKVHSILEPSVTAECAFREGTVTKRSTSHPYGSYSLLPEFSPENCTVDFMGLPVLEFEFQCRNRTERNNVVGGTKSLHKYGRYEVVGKALVDFSKRAFGYVGSMLSGASFPVSGTFRNGERDKIIFSMPDCRMYEFPMNVNEQISMVSFRAYESADGSTAPIKLSVWTQNYSATSFQPN